MSNAKMPLDHVHNWPIPVLYLDCENAIVVSIGATSAASAVLDASDERIALLVATVDCWWTRGASPTASAGAGSVYLAAGNSVMVPVYAGEKIAVIRASEDGTLSITLAEMGAS